MNFSSFHWLLHLPCSHDNHSEPIIRHCSSPIGNQICIALCDIHYRIIWGRRGHSDPLAVYLSQPSVLFQERMNYSFGVLKRFLWFRVRRKKYPSGFTSAIGRCNIKLRLYFYKVRFNDCVLKRQWVRVLGPRRLLRVLNLVLTLNLEGWGP